MTLWRKVSSEWPSWGDERLGTSKPENKGGGENHTEDGVPNKYLEAGIQAAIIQIPPREGFKEEIRI